MTRKEPHAPHPAMKRHSPASSRTSSEGIHGVSRRFLMGHYHHDCDYEFGVLAPLLPAGSVSLPHSGMLNPCGVNTSTEKVNVLPSPARSAPTPTICRPTSSPLSFLIEIITEYSHASPTFGWRIAPSTRRGENVGCASSPGTKRRCLRHDGHTAALARTTARQCGQVLVVPAGVFRTMLTTRDETPS